MDAQLSLKLYRANTELQLRAAQLLQDGAREWLAAVQHLGAAGPHLESQPDRESQDGVCGLAPRLLWHLLDGRLGAAHGLGEVAFRSQLMFAMGMQPAVLDWQKRVLCALDGGAPSGVVTTSPPRARRGAASSSRTANE